MRRSVITDGCADETFNLFRDEVARYPLTQEGHEKLDAFKDAYSEDEAAVSYLATLKSRVTPIVSTCYFTI